MDDEIRSGLEAYANGDVESALTAWAGIDRADPRFEHVREYLEFVRENQPSLFQEVLGHRDEFEPKAEAPPQIPPAIPPEGGLADPFADEPTTEYSLQTIESAKAMPPAPPPEATEESISPPPVDSLIRPAISHAPPPAARPGASLSERPLDLDLGPFEGAEAVEATPAVSASVEAEAEPEHSAPVEVEAVAEVSSPVEAEAEAEVSAPVEVEAVPEVSSPVEVEAEAEVSSPVEVEAVPEVSSPVEVEAVPEVSSPVEVEAVPEVSSPVEVEAVPEVSSPVEVEAVPEVSSPVEVEAVPEVSSPVEVEAVPQDAGEANPQVAPDPSDHREAESGGDLSVEAENIGHAPGAQSVVEQPPSPPVEAWDSRPTLETPMAAQVPSPPAPLNPFADEPFDIPMDFQREDPVADEPAPGSDGAFGLVEQVEDSKPEAGGSVPEDPSTLPALESRLAELSELDDLSGALEIASKILARDPEHHAARAAQERSREILMKMSVSKIGDLSRVPSVLCPPDQVIWLDLDHRSGFVLSQVDGVSSYHEIMEIAGMDPLECVTILAELVSEGVIGDAA